MSAEPVVPTTAPAETAAEPNPKAEAPSEPAPTELLEAGIALTDSEEAIDVLSRALELIVAKEGELHPSTARFYHEYGRALVESSKADQDVFAKIESETKKGDTDEKQEIPAEEAAKEASPKNDEEATPAETEAAPSEPSAPTTDATATEAGSSKAEAPSNEEGGEAATSSTETKSTAEMVEARELAWELLETARVVYEKSGEERHLEIASVHCLLGDVSMEDGNFARAYQEYVKATQLFGKHAGVADRRLGSAHQLAGLCSLYDQQNEASIFHYTAAAEAFNNALTETLVKHEIMERPAEETEDIEFVDEALIEKMKEKAGEESEAYKEVMELNGIVNNLIERIEEIQEQMENDAKNPQMQEILAKLGQKIAEQFAQQHEASASTSNGFDKPTASAAPCEGATEINVLVPKKRPAPATSEAAAKKLRQD